MSNKTTGGNWGICRGQKYFRFKTVRRLLRRAARTGNLTDYHNAKITTMFDDAFSTLTIAQQCAIVQIAVSRRCNYYGSPCHH